MVHTCHCEELLKKSGLERTDHRDLVLKILARAKRTLNAKDILEKIPAGRSMDKVTLYRILDLFIAKHILKKISSFQGVTSYEIICDEHRPMHPHFICRECGVMECLEEVNMQRIKLNFKSKPYIKKEDIDLKVEGLCAHCRG